MGLKLQNIRNSGLGAIRITYYKSSGVYCTVVQSYLQMLTGNLAGDELSRAKYSPGMANDL